MIVCMIYLLFLIPTTIGLEHMPRIVSNPDYTEVSSLARLNGLSVSKDVVNAIVTASSIYKIPIREMAAIAIVETAIGNNIRVNVNRNGTKDVGLFQINTVNHVFCKGLDLTKVRDNSLCAAMLLRRHKQRHKDYVGVYHSKTLKKKMIYLQKIAKVLKRTTDK